MEVVMGESEVGEDERCDGGVGVVEDYEGGGADEGGDGEK